jgi:hypothetical protein
MGLILSEPIKKVVEIPKIFAKLPLETQKTIKSDLTGPAHRPGEKGEKKKHNIGRPFFRRKNCFIHYVGAVVAPYGRPKAIAAVQTLKWSSATAPCNKSITFRPYHRHERHQATQLT